MRFLLCFALGAVGCARSTTAPEGTGAGPGAASATATSTARARCGASVHVVAGDTIQDITRRCYGSRTYQAWLIAHNHRSGPKLRVGEVLAIPPFERLITEQLGARYQGEAPGIAAAYIAFRDVEDEIDDAFRATGTGIGPFIPSPRVKVGLVAAADALRPVVTRLKAAGVRSLKFSDAMEQLERLAAGKGDFSYDYTTEGIHQAFGYGVDALR